MPHKVGRNDPCPCGSGKKYKKCCLRTARQQDVAAKRNISPKFRFEPGTYGAAGSFVPSIACLKQITPDEWDYHFVIVRPHEHHREEEAAFTQAEKDLNMGFFQKTKSGSDFAVAEYLKANGYVSVTDFKIVKEGKTTGVRH